MFVFGLRILSWREVENISLCLLPVTGQTNMQGKVWPEFRLGLLIQSHVCIVHVGESSTVSAKLPSSW